MSDVSVNFNPDTYEISIQGLRVEQAVALATALATLNEAEQLTLAMTGMGEFGDVTASFLGTMYEPLAACLAEISDKEHPTEPCICDKCTIRQILEIRESSPLN